MSKSIWQSSAGLESDWAPSLRWNFQNSQKRLTVSVNAYSDRNFAGGPDPLYLTLCDRRRRRGDSLSRSVQSSARMHACAHFSSSVSSQPAYSSWLNPLPARSFSLRLVTLIPKLSHLPCVAVPDAVSISPALAVSELVSGTCKTGTCDSRRCMRRCGNTKRGPL